ncbi:hypothetical protein N3K66_009024 [Trichothecium roseum]|uniref:Uncharacterized protein n=1 Tax=Trichothecium roseum TaxID=47278 RepID=A0ACC0URH1_9HYPO|nr:hypothetical protein N3K66_009024 [Trichothecium roseum]
MPVQQTFTLVPKNPVPNARVTTRPMTSKQVKKAHKATNRQPKLSRQEQRRLDLAEQERIRKELDKEKQAARARAARERKKEKELAEREAKRKRGGPLVAPRASQDLISRFMRGVDGSKQREEGGAVVEEMPVLEEAEEENPEQTEPVPEHLSRSPTPQLENDATGLSGTDAPAKASTNQEKLPGSDALATNKDADESASEEPRVSFRLAFDESVDEKIDEAACEGDVTITIRDDYDKDTHEKTPATETNSQGSMPSHINRGELEQASVWQETTNTSLRQETTEIDVLPIEISADDLAGFNGPPCTQYEGLLDDDSLLLLLGSEMQIQQVEEPQQKLGPLMEEEEEEDEEVAAPEPELPALKAGITDVRKTSISEEHFDDLDDIDDVTEEEIRMLTLPTKQPRDTTQNAHHRKGSPLAKPGAQPPRLKSHSSNSLDLLIDELDDDMIDEIDNAMMMNASPSKTAKTPANPTTGITTPAAPVIAEPPRKRRRTASPYERDLGLAPAVENHSSSSPPRPPYQPPPLSTQAILGNLDDFFPSQSQQARELDDEDETRLLQSSSSSSSHNRHSPLKQPALPPPRPPGSQKRFFTSSGTSECMSLALHRSRRDAAMDELRRKQKERAETRTPAQKPPGEKGGHMGPPLRPSPKINSSRPSHGASTPRQQHRRPVNPPTVLRSPLQPRTQNTALKRPVSRRQLAESPLKSRPVISPAGVYHAAAAAAKRTAQAPIPAQAQARGAIAPPPVPKAAGQLAGGDSTADSRARAPSFTSSRPKTPAAAAAAPKTRTAEPDPAHVSAAVAGVVLPARPDGTGNDAPQASPPSASQSSEYGGAWMDELDVDLVV